jgi:hypothetical protein
MSPPEGGRNIHVTSLRRSREALAIDQCLGLVTPAVLVVQSSQLCPGQRIECLAAIGAAVSRPPLGLTPGTHVVPPTMGTSQTGDTATHSLRDQNFGFFYSKVPKATWTAASATSAIFTTRSIVADRICS